jgi:hypothetical protein
MHSRKYLLALLPLALLLTACLPQPTLFSDLFLEDNSLVTGDVCAAPCWHDIVPGQTTWNEAVAIIEGDASFAGLDTNTEEADVVQAVWQKKDSKQFCCRILGDAQDQPVSYIFLALAPGIIVDDVINRYGDPDYVTTFEFTDTEFVVQLVYTEVPMVVSALVRSDGPSLLANSPIVAVLYMDSTEMALILDTTELRAWAGYQAYDAYTTGTPVVTPRITLTPPPED